MTTLTRPDEQSTTSEASTNDPLAEMLEEVSGLLGGVFEQMDWAEEEIEAAAKRHPAKRDLLYHGFKILSSTHEFMSTEMVFRAHCRELLERLATGADTRPGTAAEVCCLCSEMSLAVPLKSSAAGLYIRMWGAAFPDVPFLTDSAEHHEALEGSLIDDLEAVSREKLAVHDRVITDITCGGKHHGKKVRCTYASAPVR